MAERAKRKPNYARRIFWLGVFVVLLFGGYSAGWFYLANLLETEAKAAIASANRDGMSAECANPTARGYPFRLGLFCDRVAFTDPAQGFGVTAGGFRSAGQIYDPMRFVAELDGPAAIDLPQGVPLALNWDALRASVRLAQPLPQRISVEGRKFSIGFAAGTTLGTVDAFEAHMRPNGADLDLAGSMDNLKVDSTLAGGRTLPVMSGQSDVSITEGVALALSGVETLRGRSGTIRTLALTTGADAGVSVAGTFAVDAEGLLDANLQVTIRNPPALSAAAAEAFPEARDKIVASFAGLAALGAQPSLPLRVAKGKATLGFIPLGEIPPLK